MNELFRDHVTSVGFNLSLGKTHIAALVEMDYKLKWNMTLRQEFDAEWQRIKLPRVHSWSVPAHEGLIVRGLLIRTGYEPKERGRFQDIKPRRFWKITTAGRLVIRLLKESGIYQEYAEPFEAMQRLNESEAAA